jgi:hypothetical protein
MRPDRDRRNSRKPRELPWIPDDWHPSVTVSQKFRSRRGAAQAPERANVRSCRAVRAPGPTVATRYTELAGVWKRLAVDVGQ